MLICVHWRYGTPKSAISHIMWLGISCSNRFLNENGEYGYRNTHHSELFPPFTTGFFWYIIWEWVKTIKKNIHVTETAHDIINISSISLQHNLPKLVASAHLPLFIDIRTAWRWRKMLAWLPAESRLLLGKEAAAPNTLQVALLLGDSWDDLKKTAWNINESTS